MNMKLHCTGEKKFSFLKNKGCRYEPPYIRLIVIPCPLEQINFNFLQELKLAFCQKRRFWQNSRHFVTRHT